MDPVWTENEMRWVDTTEVFHEQSFQFTDRVETGVQR